MGPCRKRKQAKRRRSSNETVEAKDRRLGKQKKQRAAAKAFKAETAPDAKPGPKAETGSDANAGPTVANPVPFDANHGQSHLKAESASETTPSSASLAQSVLTSTNGAKGASAAAGEGEQLL